MVKGRSVEGEIGIVGDEASAFLNGERQHGSVGKTCRNADGLMSFDF